MVPGNEVACPQCGLSIINDGSFAGRLAQCPRCARQFTMPGGLVLPEPPPVVKVHIPRPEPKLLAETQQIRQSDAPLIRRRRDRSPWLAVAIVALVCAVAVWFVVERTGGIGPRSSPANAAKASIKGGGDSSPEFRAVMAYLKENTNDPDIEIVRWWPARDLVELKQSRIDGADNGIEYFLREAEHSEQRSTEDGEDDSGIHSGAARRHRKSAAELRQESLDVKHSSPLRACRIKYRAGGSLHDDVYRLKHGKPIPTEPNRDYDDYDIQHWMKKLD